MISSYYLSPNVLSPVECQTIINYCSSKCKPSTMLDLNDYSFEDKSIRNTVSTFLTNSDYKTLPMIQKVIDNVVKTSDEFFKFPIGFIEDIQYAEYTEGMYYNDHIDSGETVKYDRDISASVILSPRNEYEGGNLCFRQSHGLYLDVNEQQGTVVVFSSMLTHRVKQVKKGKRSSLVLWCRRPL